MLEVAHWLNGDPVRLEAGGTYVLVFWATGNAPSVMSFERFTALQERFADQGVTVIGVTSEEPEVVRAVLDTDDGTGRPWRDRVGYVLAADPDGSTQRDYLATTGQRGIPTVMVVGRDGRIEWIGPGREAESVIEAMTGDRWDRQAFRNVLRMRRELRGAIAGGRATEALELADELIKRDVIQADRHRFTKFSLLVKRLGRPDEGYTVARSLAEDRWNDANTLNQIAWFIVDDPGVPVRDLDLAMEIANRASELTLHRNAPILDTVARVHYEKGDLVRAIEWQLLAVQHAKGTRWQKMLTETLVAYETTLPAY